MLRKLCKHLLPALLAAGLGVGGARGQAPSPATGAQAAIWAATAGYVYRDDRDLQPILPALQKTIKTNSLAAFGHGIDEAVVLENKQLPGQRHVLKFQELYKTTPARGGSSADLAALGQAIIGKLRGNQERMADPARRQQLAQLEQQLSTLAGSVPAAGLPPVGAPAADSQLPSASLATASPTASAAPLAAADTLPADAPAATVASGAAQAPSGSQTPWLALAGLGVAVLSLLGVGILWNKLADAQARLGRLRHDLDKKAEKHAGGESFSPAKLAAAVEQEVARQLAKRVPGRLTPAPAAPAPAQQVPPAAVPAPPAPRVRTQYVGEAPFHNSFPARALSDQPSAYSMFAIESSEQQPDHGTFAVTGNLASHVRDHRSVLEPVCEYVGGSPLGSETRVVTEQPGQVRRRGDDWEVVQRAKVRFE